MAGRASLTCTLEVVPVVVRRGLWCPACALPAAVEVKALLARPSDLLLVEVRRHVLCLECGTEVALP